MKPLAGLIFLVIGVLAVFSVIFDSVGEAILVIALAVLIVSIVFFLVAL